MSLKVYKSTCKSEQGTLDFKKIWWYWFKQKQLFQTQKKLSDMIQETSTKQTINKIIFKKDKVRTQKSKDIKDYNLQETEHKVELSPTIPWQSLVFLQELTIIEEFYIVKDKLEKVIKKMRAKEKRRKFKHITIHDYLYVDSKKQKNKKMFEQIID